MDITQTLHHPEEKFWKSFFLKWSIFYYGTLNLYGIAKNFILTKSFSSPLFLQNIVSVLMGALILYFLSIHSIKKNKTSFTTFLIGIELFRIAYTLGSNVMYFLDFQNPITKTVFLINYPYLYIIILLMGPIWVYVAYKVRKINQLNNIRENIESSYEALKMLKNIESPQSIESIQQVMNYILFRLPSSQHSLVKPLEQEAMRRLAIFLNKDCSLELSHKLSSSV